MIAYCVDIVVVVVVSVAGMVLLQVVSYIGIIVTVAHFASGGL